jgi:hypothetical protein
MTLLAEIALVALAGLAVAVSVALLPDPGSLRRPRAAARAPSRPEQLERLERLVGMSGASVLQVHAYLRPLLAEIASRRLAARGQALDRMSDADGRKLLGEELWDVVRPGRPFPEDRTAPGLSPLELGAMLEVLERL